MLPYDSGNYEVALDRALERSATPGFARNSASEFAMARTSCWESAYRHTSRFAESLRPSGSVCKAKVGAPASGKAPTSRCT